MIFCQDQDRSCSQILVCIPMGRLLLPRRINPADVGWTRAIAIPICCPICLHHLAPLTSISWLYTCYLRLYIMCLYCFYLFLSYHGFIQVVMNRCQEPKSLVHRQWLPVVSGDYSVIHPDTQRCFAPALASPEKPLQYSAAKRSQQFVPRKSVKGNELVGGFC